MKIEQLKEFEILCRLDERTLAEILPTLREGVYCDGDSIFRKGDPADAICFIEEGTVIIQKDFGEKDSFARTLGLLSFGDFFGEMALLDMQPHSVSAVASGNVKLFKLSRAVVQDLLLSRSMAGVHLLCGMVHTFSERTRWLNNCMVVYDEVGKEIGQRRGLQPLLETVIQLLSHAVESDWSLLLIKPEFSDHLEARCGVHIELRQDQHEEVSQLRGILQYAKERQEPLLIKNRDNDARIKRLERLSFESVSMLCLPILSSDEFLGLILLGHASAAYFNLNHMNLCQGVARQAAQAILSARHREEETSRSRHGRKFVRF